MGNLKVVYSIGTIWKRRKWFFFENTFSFLSFTKVI